MPGTKLTVVLAQSRSKNPVKRALEEEICTAMITEPGIDVSVVPHLYDLNDDHTGTLFLRSLAGEIVVLGWLYPRAAHWVLDRFGVKGKVGKTLLQSDEDAEEEDENDVDSPPEEETASEQTGASGADAIPDRRIYCLDLRDSDSAESYIEEIRRIAAEASVETVPLGNLGQTSSPPAAPQNGNGHNTGPIKFLEGAVDRRWYPVIDFNRCTNCLECIDFCLFGVYGTDVADRIVVEQPDNCRKGCPACSRVCPENAIVFPEHKAPAIAGAPGEGAGGLKIDLSKLFGAPDAVDTAAQERDIELIKAGRKAVGMNVGIPKRRSNKTAGPRDELDDLMDALDAADL